MTADAGAPATTSDASTDPSSKPPVHRRWLALLLVPYRRWLPLLLVPYVVGIVWHGLHAHVSVFTGHAKPRGWYIDENSLDPSYFKQDTQVYYKNLPKISSRGDLCLQVQHHLPISSLAQMDCRSNERLQVLQIVPVINTAVSPKEAVVLVLPQLNKGKFHSSLLRLVERLTQVPWLAKTVLIVAPAADQSLKETVEIFLDTSLGAVSCKNSTSTCSGEHSRQNDAQNELFFGSDILIRQLVVLDNTRSTTQTNSKPKLRILVQGRNGVLPNMDLVSMIQRVYQRASFWDAGRTALYYDSKENDEWWEQYIAKLPASLQSWARRVHPLLRFESSLALGPYPPHAAALDRGIDALTLDLQYDKDKVVTEYVYRLEHVLRALSNLHERLHHSTSLYLFPNVGAFVKHEEYLVPNLLLLIPLILRALTLVFLDIERFDWEIVGEAVGGTVTVVLVVATLVPIVDSTLAAANLSMPVSYVRLLACALAYAGLLLLWKSRQRTKLDSNARQSLQFVACLAAIYLQVPVAFGHVSVAFPSALLWTPLIGFVSFRKTPWSRPAQILAWLTILMTASAPWVAGVWFSVEALLPYFVYVYLPLQILVTLLYTS